MNRGAWVAGDRMNTSSKHKGVDVRIEVEGSPEALNDGEGAAVAVPERVASGGAPEPAEDGADEHAQDSAAATRYHAEARCQPLSRKDPL